MKKNLTEKVMKRICLTALFSLCYFSMFPQFFYDETCRNGYGVFVPRTHHTHPGYSNNYQGGNYAAYVEGGSGNGWLRLTLDGGTYAIGYVYTDRTYTSNLGLVVEFDFKTYGMGTVRTNPKVDIPGVADGFSVFLFNGNTDLSYSWNLGYSGGGLGYMPYGSGYGLYGGYLAVGVDEYGNFNQLARYGTLDVASNLLSGVTVVGGEYSSPAYKYIGHTTTSQFWVSGTSSRPSDATMYRRIRIQVDPIGYGSGARVNVYLKTSTSGSWTPVVSNYTLNDVVPSNLRVGFAASVGGATGTHEIRDIIIRTSGSLSVFKAIPPQTCLTYGQQFDIRTILTNGDPVQINPIAVSDTMPAGFVLAGGYPTISGGSMSSPTNTLLSDGRRVYNYTVNLPSLATATVTFRGSVTTGSPSVLRSGVYINPPSSFTDNSYSDNISVIVYNILGPGSIAKDQGICYGATPERITSTQAATGGTGSFTYNWQQSTNNSTWVNAADIRNQAYYDPPALTSTMYYRRQAINSSCGTVVSDVVTITVSGALNTGTISADQIICSGETPAGFSSVIDADGGDGGISYQWQYTEDSTWSDISGATSSTYTPTSGITKTTRYRRSVIGSCGGSAARLNSNEVTVTVKPRGTAAIIKADNLTICAGSATMSITASLLTVDPAIVSPVFKWYNSGGDWLYTGNPFTPSQTTSATYYVSVEGSNYCANLAADRKAVTVTAVEALEATSITPANPVICTGGVTLTATKDDATSYQWYKDGNPIDGATSQTYYATTAGDYSVSYSTSVCSSPKSAEVEVVVAGPFTVSGKVIGLENNVGVTVYYKIDGGTTKSVISGVGGAYSIPDVACGSDVYIIPSNQDGYTTPNDIEVLNVTDDVPDQDIIYKRAVYRWWYISTPFSDSNSNSFDIPAGTVGKATGSMLGYYDEQAKQYINDPLGANQTLRILDGIVASLDTNIAVFNPPTIATLKRGGYSNIPNTGLLTTTIYDTDTVPAQSLKHGKNLLGNPYLNPIDFDLFSSLMDVGIDNAERIEPTYWVRGWNRTTMIYDTYNVASQAGTDNITTGSPLTKVIPVMQGFWVQAKATGIIGYTNDIQITGSPIPAYRLPVANASRIARLTVKGEGSSDQAIIVINPEALDGYDKYDSEKMGNGDNSIPEIYTKIGNREIAINGISPITNEASTPLGFRTGKAGSFTISANFENWDNTKIFLRDNNTSIETELTAGKTYSFTSNVYNNTTRFSIIIKGGPAGINNIEQNTKVFVNEKNRIEIQTDIINTECIVYNALGQQLNSETITSCQQTLDCILEAGVYLVKVGNITERVIIK